MKSHVCDSQVILYNKITIKEIQQKSKQTHWATSYTRANKQVERQNERRKKIKTRGGKMRRNIRVVTGLLILCW